MCNREIPVSEKNTIEKENNGNQETRTVAKTIAGKEGGRVGRGSSQARVGTKAQEKKAEKIVPVTAEWQPKQ